jgi:outer membrane receptor protein involved in Fe transport
MRTLHFLDSYLRCGTALAALMAAGAAQAQAAQPAPTPTPSDVAAPPTAEAQAPTPPSENEQIVVTGTRVVRDGYQAPTPLTVVTREDIQNTAPTNNIADLVNQLPALAGSTRPSNSRLELSSGIGGVNTLNLRNLGTVRTLVLLDGRRSVGSTVQGLVDVNTIPQLLVDRVEIVTGGASAAYGSDAVAGVVNFVLNKKLTGIRVESDIGITDKGDGLNYSTNVAGGFSFGGGRGHILLAGEFAHKDGIFEVDREWNQTGYVRIQDPAWTSTSTTPQFLIRRQVGAANSTPGGLITGSAGGVANRLRGIYFGQAGAINQYNYGALTFPSPTGASAPSLTQGGDWRVNDSGRRIGLDPKDERRGGFARASFEVADNVNLWAEGSYNWQNVRFNAGPNLMTGLTLNATGCGTAATAAAAPATCNAFLYNALGPARLAGITSVTLATTAADLPYRVTDNTRKVMRLAAGMDGTFNLFGKPAHWDFYGQYGKAKLHEQLRNIQQTQFRANALNAVFTNGGTSIACAVNADAITTNDDPACVPLNLLGLGVANAAAIDYVLGDPYRNETLEQTVFGANLSLTPFHTWAGDVSVAVGAEYRKEQVHGFVPTVFQPTVSNGVTTTRWSVGNYLPTNGSYNVKEAYLETVVPLGFGLEFNGAVRATDYSTSGYVTTWKLGATWQPIDDIRFRVTRSRDIRAPNLNELYQGGTQNTDTVRNPFFPNAGPGSATYPNSLPYLGTVTGSTNLKPEKADQWNIGAVVSPRFLPGFTASIDYYRINLKGAIDVLTAQQIIDRCFEGNQQTCAAIVPDPSTPGRVLISRSPFNYARILSRGVDFDAAYRRKIGPGAFTLRGVATRNIDNIVNTGLPGAVIVNTAGATSLPKWFFRASANYDTPSYSVTLVGRGVSSSVYDKAAIECQTSCPVSTTQHPTYDDLHISGSFYVDLNLTKKFNVMGRGDGEFFVNVTNVFDRWPILVPETGLAANTTYSDLLGRAYRAGIRLKFR